MNNEEFDNILLSADVCLKDGYDEMLSLVNKAVESFKELSANA